MTYIGTVTPLGTDLPQSDPADWDRFPLVDEKPAAKATSPADWDRFPLVTPEKTPSKTPSDVGYLEDAGRSLKSGVLRGVSDIVGLPDTIGKGLQFAEQKIRGEDDDQYAQRLADRKSRALLPDVLPSRDRVLDAIDNQVGGAKYEPQTTPGEYARTIGEFIPGALAGGGGVVGNVLKYGVAPALASETAGQVTKGTAAEPWARGIAGVGAGFGASMLARPSTAQAALAKQLPAYVTKAHVDRAEKVMAAGKARGIDLTWPEALSKVTGRPVLTDMQRLLESAPDSRVRMQDFFAPRPQQVEAAARQEFDRIAPRVQSPSSIGPEIGHAAEHTISDVRRSINAAAEPYYTKSAGVLLTPQEMTQVRAIPGYAEAAQTVRNDPQLNRYVAHLPEHSVGFLNEVKKVLDTAKTNAASPLQPNRSVQRSTGYGMDAEAVKRTATNKSVDYATALGVESVGRERYLDPLLRGPLGRLADKDLPTQRAIEALFPSAPLPGHAREVETAIRAVAKRNPGAAALLVRAHVESVFDEAARNLVSGPNQSSGGNFVKALVGNSEQRATMQAAMESLPQQHGTWPGFEKFLEILEATGRRQQKGSLTAFNVPELASHGSGGMVAGATKLGLSPSKWMRVVDDKWSRWQMGRNLDELAKISTDPRSGPILRRIASAPPLSREAIVLTTRLIAIGQTGARHNSWAAEARK